MSWAKLPLRRLFRVVNGGTPTADEENWGGDIPWATPIDLGMSENSIRSTQRTLTHKGLQSGSRAVPSGSLLLSTRAPVGYIARAEVEMSFNQGCKALVKAEELDERFFMYQLLVMTDYLQSRSLGSTFLELSAEALAATQVVVPSIEEQRRIADFLDFETSRIESIAEKLRCLESLLQAREWSVFDRNLSGLDARFLPVRRLLQRVTDGPFGSAFLSSDYSDSGAVVVRLGNIGFNEYRTADQARIPLAIYRKFLRYRVRPGDLLIAGLGDANNHAGRACVAPDLGPAMVKGKCFAARVDEGIVRAPYLALILSSPVGEQAFVSRGSTRSMINLELVKSAVVPVPSLSEQVDLLDGFNSERSAIQRALEVIGHQASLLVERRQALITAAVTGQIDVTTAQGIEV